MMNSVYMFLFEFLRRAVGVSTAEPSPVNLSSEEWSNLYDEAKRQSVVDVIFTVVNKLPKSEHPPRLLLMRWAAHAEATRDMNMRMNREAARLTEIFRKEGRRTAVLKGAANARLYPDPYSRQCGDIDFWIEGGHKSVEKLLLDLKLIPEPEVTAAKHHIHLPPNQDGIIVEAHYKLASGNPFKDRDLQKFLNEEIATAQLVPEGFYAPSIKFALVMQLSHIQQHFYYRGLGLRQYMDYFILLQHSTEQDRRDVAAILKKLYMEKACSAVMWVLCEVFCLKREMMLCAPNEYRGKRLLKLAMDGGNFGKHELNSTTYSNVFVRWFNDRLRMLSWIPFDPINVIFKELKYWKTTISLIPQRIKRRRIGL